MVPSTVYSMTACKEKASQVTYDLKNRLTHSLYILTTVEKDRKKQITGQKYRLCSWKGQFEFSVQFHRIINKGLPCQATGEEDAFSPHVGLRLGCKVNK